MNNKENNYWQDVEQKVLGPEQIKNEFHEGELSFDIGTIKKKQT